MTLIIEEELKGKLTAECKMTSQKTKELLDSVEDLSKLFVELVETH